MKTPIFGGKRITMIETIFTTIAGATLFITSAAFMPQTTTDVALTHTLPHQSYVSYAVESDQSLAAISQKYYGSEDYWTNIWNDNNWITDPESVEKGHLVKINPTKPEVAATLDSVLADRAAAVTEQKNQEYLKSIGYLQGTSAVVATVPTVTPIITQAPVNVAVAANASGISEEAITALGACEAGNDPAKNTGNGYYGAFQFSAGTWNSMNTGYERADLAPIEVQRAAVKQLLQRSSIHNQFPGCANKMRNAGLI